jgi:hypothetical protein
VDQESNKRALHASSSPAKKAKLVIDIDDEDAIPLD